VRTCVIFNPTARGDKARRLRRHLDELGSQCTLKLTTCPGDARRLAREAVGEGFETIVAAGGDGTLNEVLNGITDAPGGIERARLGLLPLGTVNVYACEMAIPTRFEEAWDIIRRGTEKRIDLPSMEYQSKEGRKRHYFAQMAGAGLDATAIEMVHWPLKKKIGPLAYVVAGLKALAGKQSKVTAAGGGHSFTGEMVLIGNGVFYGGRYHIFPEAHMQDGLLEVCIFPRVNWFVLARCAPSLLLTGRLPRQSVETFRADTLTLASPTRTPLEADGEIIGTLPATFSVQRSALRVIVP
jgi:diacylglycerol kinase (ATP)